MEIVARRLSNSLGCHERRGMRRFLVGHLCKTECLILEASNLDGMISLLRCHSRPIHVLLLSIDIGDAASAERLKRYRPAMCVLYVKTLSKEGLLEAAEAREMLKPKKRAASS
jgi:hypothetical protein